MEISTGYSTGLDLSAYLLEKESKTISENIGHDDQVVHVAKQRRLSGAVISPALVVLTSKKIVIINRLFGGVKSDITFISHQDISSVRIAHGIIFSSVYVRIRGAVGDLGKVFKGETEEGEINGLHRGDADLIFTRLNDMRKGSSTHHVQNVFVVNQYGKNAEGTWSAESAEPQEEEGERLYAPYRLAQYGEQLPELQVSNDETEEKRLLPPQQTTVVASGGTTQQMIKADDLLIFKMRKENPGEFSVIL
jgi:hypothetical protein